MQGAALFALLGSAAAAQDAPMSAIDWLSQSVAATPVVLPAPTPQEPAVSTGAAPESITVTPLGGTTLDALGLTPAQRAGLPRGLWGETPTLELARKIRAERAETLPAIQSLLYALLLAELDPPHDADGSGQLFLARVDKLLDLGALDPALALLELPDDPTPEPFRRWFDVALLIGEEDRACETMRETPQVAPTFPARIFCLARGGDWNAAALTLSTGEALGHIDAETGTLLARFLDPELADGAEDLPLPARPSPLVLRLMEAVGQPMPTTTLPLAFAQSDLRSNSGWKTRIEAGERLARTGAIGPNLLLGLYTERGPAASGGVWDRVAAVQALEAALAASDMDAVARALSPAWEKMVQAELEVPFAELYGERLAALPLKGSAGQLAFRIGLLSTAYETVAAARAPQDGVESFLVGLARGDVTRNVQPDQMGAAIRAGFAPDAALTADYAPLFEGNRLGEALLMAIDDVTEGARGDLRRVTSGLTALRKAGLETPARRAALELMLLERRG
ncbi:hypothetical protein FALB51S_03638 [Frigidibacter albus]